MKFASTYKADIYLGLSPRYTNLDSGEGKKQLVRNICQRYCDEVGLGVTITDTEFIYTEGAEKGVIIGLINYPRFPSKELDILNHARTLGTLLMKQLDQTRISIVTTTGTYMLENEELENINQPKGK